MTTFNFKLPDVGEGIAECEIAAWHVKPGDVVEEDQNLVDVLTDKAAVELPAPVAGRILECRGEVGDKVAVGSVLVVIETSVEGERPSPPDVGRQSLADNPVPSGGARRDVIPTYEKDDVGRQPLADNPVPSGGASPPDVGRQSLADNPAPSGGARRDVIPTYEKGGADPQSTADPQRARVQTSPAIRKRAREHGVDLHQVPATGPRGRITHEDLNAYLQGGTRTAQTAARPAASKAVETVKLIGLRRRIAESMANSARSIPHFAYVEEVDVTELEALRQHLNQLHGAKKGKLTLLPFLIRALINLRADFPQVNATFDEAQGLIHRHAASHIGIATQTPQGLVVPVIRHAETLDLWQTAAEIKRLAEAARSGKAKREELTGSTLTVTSLGALGGIASTPIINAPEVAIVGVNRMVERPMIRSGQVVPRLMMNLSSSFDHRIVDGHDAASFIQAVRAQLEHPACLFM
jgi:2-oxoisovalerate dehydrogenase E2 component (dihydrolipoyl transacylase)